MLFCYNYAKNYASTIRQSLRGVGLDTLCQHNFGQNAIERFHSSGQSLSKFIATKENVGIRKEFNSHRIGLGQNGRRFIVLGHKYGRRNVMWKHSIVRHFKVARYSSLGSIPPKFEHKLRGHKQRFRKISIPIRDIR